MRARRLGIAVLTGALAACGTVAETRLVVEVGSDLEVPTELDRVVITVDASAHGGPVQDATVDLSGDRTLPARLGLSYAEGRPLGPYLVTAEGFSGTDPVLTATGEAHFVAGEERTLSLFLARSCVGVTCAAGERCEGGVCVGAEMDAGAADAGPLSDAGACEPPRMTCGSPAVCADPETDPLHCGGCGVPCAEMEPNRVPTCSGGSCVLGPCIEDHASCDGSAVTGCEADLSQDVAHCGACDSPCVLMNATAACNDGSCAIDACDDGWDDCNGSAFDGCECRG